MELDAWPLSLNDTKLTKRCIDMFIHQISSSSIPQFNGTAAVTQLAAPSQTNAFVDPASGSVEGSRTRELALQQTVAARDLLYHPGQTLRT